MGFEHKPTDKYVLSVISVMENQHWLGWRTQMCGCGAVGIGTSHRSVPIWLGWIGFVWWETLLVVMMVIETAGDTRSARNIESSFRIGQTEADDWLPGTPHQTGGMMAVVGNGSCTKQVVLLNMGYCCLQCWWCSDDLWPIIREIRLHRMTCHGKITASPRCGHWWVLALLLKLFHFGNDLQGSLRLVRTILGSWTV